MAAPIVIHARLTSHRLFSFLAGKSNSVRHTTSTRQYSRFYRKPHRVLNEEEAKVVNEGRKLPERPQTSEDLWRETTSIRRKGTARSDRLSVKDDPYEEQGPDFVTYDNDTSKMPGTKTGKLKSGMSKAEMPKSHVSGKFGTYPEANEFSDGALNFSQSKVQESSRFSLPDGMKWERLTEGDKRFG